jgi:hypothetical protein
VGCKDSESVGKVLSESPLGIGFTQMKCETNSVRIIFTIDENINELTRSYHFSSRLNREIYTPVHQY